MTGIEELVDLIESLRSQLVSVERQARLAAREAHSASTEVARLRDEVVAAERDQQELRSARAKLTRMNHRGLVARVLNRS